MCGRFTQERSSSELAEIFEAEDLADLAGDRFNVAPTDEANVIVQRSERRAVTRYRWGLIPHWAEDARIGSKMFNARAETLSRSPAFRDAFARKRCLVPVDSFYEWRREGNLRIPYRIVRTDGRPLALAGLWSGWRDEETGEIRRTFTIVTAGPNSLLRPIHNRMPVVVPPEAWERWLDPALSHPSQLQGLLEPIDDDRLEAYEVSRLVNNVNNDGPELIVAAEDLAERPAAAPSLGL